MDIGEQIKEILLSEGACDVGFSCVDDGLGRMKQAISVVVPLSDAVIEEITDKPTFTYFHHYRTVNAFIDHLLLKAGLFLQKNGYRYIPIPASQSNPESNDNGERTHCGRYSHKKAAVLAGLGSIGKSTLFLHRIYGARVRLGTIFTDCPLSSDIKTVFDLCNECNLCVKNCPAGAIKGVSWREGIERSEMFDANACNCYMRDNFMKIGRGSVCGICVKVCPFTQKEFSKNTERI